MIAMDIAVLSCLSLLRGLADLIPLMFALGPVQVGLSSVPMCVTHMEFRSSILGSTCFVSLPLSFWCGGLGRIHIVVGLRTFTGKPLSHRPSSYGFTHRSVVLLIHALSFQC